MGDALMDALRARWTIERSVLDDDHSWVGDALRPVIEAAFATPELRALFPFTSVNRLCFSRCSDYPYSGDCPCIVAHAGGYTVQAWWYVSDEPAPELVHTTNLDVAITTVKNNLPSDRAAWLGDRDHRPG